MIEKSLPVLKTGIPGAASLEEELANRARQQAAVAYLGQQALLGIDLRDLMNETVTVTAQTLGVEYCEVLELLPGDQELLLVAGVGWKRGSVGRTKVGAGLDSQAGFTLASSEPVIVKDLPAETRFHGPALLLDHGVISGMSVIIQGEGRPFGVLGVHTSRKRLFSTYEENFLRSVANVLAAAVQRKRAEEAVVTLNTTLEKRVEMGVGSIRLLQEVAVAANEANSIEEAMQFVIDRICGHTGWPVGHVYMVARQPADREPGEGEVILLPTRLWHLDNKRFKKFRQATEATPLSPGSGLPGKVFASRKPEWIKAVNTAVDFVRAQAGVGIKFGFAFPVLVGKEVAAVLEFYSDQAIHLDRQLLEVMGQVGTQLGRVVERVRAEEELRQRETQLSEAQQIAHIGSWTWDIARNEVRWSAELFRIFGTEPKGLFGSFADFLERVHPDDREFTRQIVEKAYQDHRPFGFKHRIVLPDGAIRVIQAQGKVSVDEAGKPVKMLGTGQDISERVGLENALQESLSMFENLFELAPDGAVVIDEQGVIVRVNRQVEDLFGFSREELVGKPLELLVPERFRESHAQLRKDYQRHPRVRPMNIGMELSAQRKDGSEFPVEIMLSPLETGQGSLVIGMVRDITGRRQAEEALLQSELRFRTIFEGAATGIAVVDLNGRIQMTNPGLQEMLGYNEEELHGKDLNELTHPIDLEITREVYKQLFAGAVDHYQVEKRYIRKDGEVIWVHLVISLVRDEQGAPRFAVKMIEDISARKQMEAELAEVQHRLLASREHERTHLAQELHDDPMQDLYGILYQLNDFDEIIKDEEYVAQMREVRQSVQQVINTLRSICGELRSPTLAPFGLEGAIREHVEQFQEKHPQLKVTLDLMYDGSMFAEDLRLNLFRIYQQAMNNVVRHAEATQISVSFLWDEEKISLEIEDNGRGFEVPVRWIGLAREGHLGLVGANERAELMGGQFTVESHPGHGTKIRVMVPRNQGNIKSGMAISA